MSEEGRWELLAFGVSKKVRREILKRNALRLLPNGGKVEFLRVEALRCLKCGHLVLEAGGKAHADEHRRGSAPAPLPLLPSRGVR